MKTRLWTLLLIAGCAASASAQNATTQEPTLRVTSRAVVLDVIVTKDGKPVKDLPQSAFSVTEQGKPQPLTYFEEHHGVEPVGPVATPKLPQNVFSNFSAYPLPPAVNIVLLDSLNTTMDKQSWVHSQAVKFLENAKPGTQTAIFTMDLGLHFIQGFTSDPAVLVAAIKNKKNNSVQESVMLKGQAESNNEANLVGMMNQSVPGSNGGTAASGDMVAALQQFLAENTSSRGFDRYFRTLANLDRLAAFLNGFPGRKNVIWFAESVPAGFLTSPGAAAGQENPSVDAAVRQTMDKLSAARVAIYPVDARGLQTNSLYDAATVMPNEMAPSGPVVNQILTTDDAVRNGDQESMKVLADQTGGQAFMNTNGLGDVMKKIQEETSDFYTISYTPSDNNMNGAYRKIGVKVAGGKYQLSYRQGYYAVDDALPGTALQAREKGLQAYSQSHAAVDPLLPYMDLGMPVSDQILYEAKITPLPPSPSAADKANQRYNVDFAIDLKDLKLSLDSTGVHHGVLNITLLVYDRYGKIISHEEHLIGLDIKPDVYPVFQTRGVQLHAQIATPKGNYWLRTGVYDQHSRKVGTLEIPLAAVQPVQLAAQGGH
ncbi:MAG: VWA domain-containing protein [Acidobacteriota bacterium]